jgi:Flp pilus assembly protein TadG
MIVMLLAGVDVTRYSLAARAVERTTSTVAQMMSVNTVGSASTDDIHFYESSAFATFPGVLADSTAAGVAWNVDLGLAVSSVTLATPANGNPTATVSWSVGPGRRSCGPLTAVADNVTPSPTTIATDALGTGSVIVVDSRYTFKPLLATRLLPVFLIARTFYVRPRFVPSVALTGAASDAIQC